jgi:hypothetical protein
VARYGADRCRGGGAGLDPMAWSLDLAATGDLEWLSGGVPGRRGGGSLLGEGRRGA